ncbi:MAG: hypothetical protein VZR06_07070 [Butyrivibrio sp.]|nr:hypothetical protein [Butyrivibrio sp.]
MEAMDTQDILNEQDLSNANLDDLLAAMKAEESASSFERVDVGSAPDTDSSDIIDAAALEALNALAGAVSEEQEIIAADAAMTETMDNIAAEVQSADFLEGDSEDILKDTEPIDITPADMLPEEETVLTEAVTEENQAAEPSVDVDAMLTAMAGAETASDVDAMLASMVEADAEKGPEEDSGDISIEGSGNTRVDESEIMDLESLMAEVPITETTDNEIAESPITEITEAMSAEIPITESTEFISEEPEAKEPVIEEEATEEALEAAIEEPAAEEISLEALATEEPKLDINDIPDVGDILHEVPNADEEFAKETASEEIQPESSEPEVAETDAIVEEPVASDIDVAAFETPIVEEETVFEEADNRVTKLDDVLDAEVDALTEAVNEQASAIGMSMADAVSGDVDQIESFLNDKDYEYTVVNNGDKTIIILRTSESNALAITYENGEFTSLEPGYSKDESRGYSDILTAYVEETIMSGGCFEIKRHKGTKLV